MVLKVKNLVPWAGASFSIQPDDVVELPDAVAQGRAAAGLVEILNPQPAAAAGRVPGIDYSIDPPVAPAKAPASAGAAPSPEGAAKAPARV